MHFLFKLIKWLIILVLFAALSLGFYAGNLSYEELFNAPWDRILGIENHRLDLGRIHGLEDRYGWQRVMVPSKDGTELRGTYIEEGGGSSSWTVPESVHVRSLYFYVPGYGIQCASGGSSWPWRERRWSYGLGDS